MRTLPSIVLSLTLATTLFGAETNRPPTAVAVEWTAGPMSVRFQSCAEIGTEHDVIVMDGGGMTAALPGRFRVGDVFCTRSITSDVTLSEWRDDVLQGDMTAARKNGALTLLAADGSTLLRWTLTNAWPSALYVMGTQEAIVITSETLVSSGKITPQIQWLAPQAITYGDVLGAAQLNATSPVPGQFTYTPAAGSLLTAGVHTLSVSFTPADQTNYKNTTASVELTVMKADLSLTADDKQVVYGDPLPSFTYMITGFVNGETVSVVSGSPVLTSTAVVGSDAGEYPIVIATGTLAAANYNFQTSNGTLTIHKALLTVTADDKFAIYLDPLPPLTARYSGFVLDDDPSVLSGEPALVVAATPLSVPGTYPITVSEGTLAATNYRFTFVGGTLTMAGARTLLERAATLSAALPQPSQWLTDASAAAEWTDENRPLATHGQFLFTRAKDAVLKLADPSVMDLVVKACRIVAVVAIEDAVAAGADKKLIDKARGDVERGDSLRARGRLENAILEYRSAWARFH